MMRESPIPNAAVTGSSRAWRIFRRTVLGIFLLLLLLAVGVTWYMSTPQFEALVRGKVVDALERATGGRVELSALHWHLLHLEFTADNLTIHGLEGPHEIPYAHADRLYVRVKIISFFRREIGLNYLEADRPVIHLIVYPDGSTNQPHPKVPTRSTKPVMDTIFDLAVDRAVVQDGLAIVNQRATPFNAAANDLGVTISYNPALGRRGRDSYTGTIHIEDLVTERAKEAPVHSVIDARATLERNQLTLQSLTLKSGSSRLDMSGSLRNFADPQWKLNVKGGIALEEVEALSEVPGLNRGLAQLDVQGSGHGASFTVDGTGKVTGASYHTGSVHLADISAETRLHVTQDELDLANIKVRLAQGGYIDGEMKVAHWLAPVPARARPGVDIPQGTVRAKLRGIALSTVMASVAPPHYTELGFDTEVSGDATVDWLGSASTFMTGTKVSLMPPLKSAAGRVPMYGTVDAEYRNTTGLVTIHTLDVHTPASQVNVTGSLGVYPITRPSELQVNITTADLGEFDRTLTTLGVTARGKTGVNALPVALHGQALFAGTITHSILDPDVKGHVNATSIDLVFPSTETTSQTGVEAVAAQAPGQQPRSVHWDSIDGDAEYSSRHIVVNQAVLIHGPAVIHLSGELDAHAVSPRRSEFDKDSSLRADVSVQDASAQDLLQMAGESLPVTGTLNLKAHVAGSADALNGGGQLAVQGGTVYSEPYRSLSADLNFQGHEVSVANLVFLEEGGRVVGDGGYDLKSGIFHFDANGTGFQLARIQRLQNGRYAMDGALSFEAHGSGTLQVPDVQANAHIKNFSFGSAVAGYLDADAHTQGRTLLLNANADMSNAQVQVHGQVQLSGDYQTQAQVTVAKFDVDPVLRAFNVQGVAVHSVIGATANVQGPLREPKKVNGAVTVREFAASLGGVAVKSDGALHATLIDGRLHLDPLHITGEATDLHAQGSVGALTDVHDLNLQANGSVNLKLIESLDSDYTGSGIVNFNVDAAGTFARPMLTGNIRFNNASLALEDFPNGLSQMNGTLEFNQDRLDVKNLTAVSGGGHISVSGFVTYQQGFYGDLTATAKDVRIRYPQGISSMADAKLRMQGTQKAMLLSGNVTITRFVVGSDLDLSAFNTSTGGVTLPPNQDAPSNHIRLDVHILSAPQLDFQNSYAKLAGDVDLRLRGTIAQPTVLGHISITEGNATFAGTKYELQHGDIYFSNPIRIDPTIDLSATAHVEDYDITIGLTGTASKPVPTFRSEPPMSEQDIFSLLALGRTQEEQQIYSNMQSQAGVNSTADALLGGALNATLSNRIQKLFGGGSVKIDPTFVTGAGNSTARITMEQQIGKNATLTYATNVNSTAQQLIQGQINLTPTFSVIAVRDEAGVFSLIFKIRRRYR